MKSRNGTESNNRKSWMQTLKKIHAEYQDGRNEGQQKETRKQQQQQQKEAKTMSSRMSST